MGAYNTIRRFVVRSYNQPPLIKLSIFSVAYESAVKRRKGAVRSVITDQKKPYTGEASGIRAGIKKSVRIKS